MASLTIRKLDDELYRRIGIRAKQNERSIEAEVREILAQNVPSKHEIAMELAEYQLRMRAKHGELPDSGDLIRQMRDSE